jgi:hypothetical protein
MSIPFVPDDRLARFRALDERAMPEQCTVVHTAPGTLNPDGSPGNDTTVVTSYPCRVAPLGNSPVEQVIAARLTDVTGFLVTLPFDANVQETDTIQYGAQTLQVLGVLNPSSYQTSIRVATKRIS